MSPAISPLIDEERLAVLAEALGQGKFLELCEMARQSIALTKQDLHAAWRADDLAALARHAHRLVGVAANFGLPALSEMARKIEETARGGNDGKSFEAPLDQLVEHSGALLPRAVQE